MEITKDVKTNIAHDLEFENDEGEGEYRAIYITIDHEDSNTPFLFSVDNLGCDNWYSIEVLQNLKKVIDKALKIHKAGAK